LVDPPFEDSPCMEPCNRTASKHARSHSGGRLPSCAMVADDGPLIGALSSQSQSRQSAAGAATGSSYSSRRQVSACARIPRAPIRRPTTLLGFKYSCTAFSVPAYRAGACWAGVNIRVTARRIRSTAATSRSPTKMAALSPRKLNPAPSWAVRAVVTRTSGVYQPLGPQHTVAPQHEPTSFASSLASAWSRSTTAAPLHRRARRGRRVCGAGPPPLAVGWF